MEPRLLSVFFSIVLLAAGKHKIKICDISLTDIVWGFINQHGIILALGMSFLCCFFQLCRFYYLCATQGLPEWACCLCLHSSRQVPTRLHSRISLRLLELVTDIQSLERLEFPVANSLKYTYFFSVWYIIYAYFWCRNDVFTLIHTLQCSNWGN